MKFKIKITCDEATTICDKSQYGEASLWERFKLNVHFLQCKICRCYSSQNTFLSKLYQKHAESKKTVEKSLCDADKRSLEEAIKQQLQK